MRKAWDIKKKDLTHIVAGSLIIAFSEFDGSNMEIREDILYEDEIDMEPWEIDVPEAYHQGKPAKISFEVHSASNERDFQVSIDNINFGGDCPED